MLRIKLKILGTFDYLEGALLEAAFSVFGVVKGAVGAGCATVSLTASLVASGVDSAVTPVAGSAVLAGSPGTVGLSVAAFSLESKLPEDSREEK